MEERYKGGIKTRAKLTVHKLQFFFLDQQAWERYKRQFKPRQDGDEETLHVEKKKKQCSKTSCRSTRDIQHLRPSEQNPSPPYLSSPLIPFLPLPRSKTDHLQTRPPLSLTKHHNPFPSKTRPPHRITRFRQLPHKPARFHIPQLHPPVVPAGDDEPLIKL